MKNSKLRRALLLVASAVLLVCVSVGATLAYLTAETEVVTNTFSVGNVEITLDETNTDGKDKDGNANTDKERDTANEYHLLPNDVHTKDPIVHVDDESEDCYLFVKVVNGLVNIESTASDEPNVKAQMEAKGWFAVDGYTDVYCYYGPNGSAPLKVVADSDITVFEKVYISENAHNDAAKNDSLLLSKYEDATIEVTAYAIQADGWTSPDAVQLWKALNGIQ